MENNSYPLQNKRPLSLDGVQSRTMTAPSVPTPQPRRSYTRSRPVTQNSQKKNIWQKLQLPLLILGGVTGGFFADNLAFGLALLAAYGIAAFVMRISSRISFALALLLLVAISILLLFKPNMQLIGNFATYAFALMLIGAITLGREVSPAKRTKRKYRR